MGNHPLTTKPPIRGKLIEHDVVWGVPYGVPILGGPYAAGLFRFGRYPQRGVALKGHQQDTHHLVGPLIVTHTHTHIYIYIYI